MDSINITVTGQLGGDPKHGTTRNGKAWASFSLAADVPARGRGGEREYQTRWYKVWCYDLLAEHVAESLAKGDRVTVRADDVTCNAWIPDGPGQQPRGQTELKAYEVSLSLRFSNAVAVRAPRADEVPADAAPADGDPWAGPAPVDDGTTVPDVLAGVTA